MLKTLSLALVLTGAGFIAIAEEAATVILQPEWLSKPSGQDIARYYPRRAVSREVSGWALLSCRLNDRGFVRDCRVAAEAPDGWEFGVATLALSTKFRMKPPNLDAQSLQRARVRIPVSWTFSGNPAPPKNFDPGAPSMLITVVDDEAAGAGIFECPTEAHPRRRCKGAQLSWEVQPLVEDIATEIRAAGGGRSLMECITDAVGALQDCRVANKSALPDADVIRLASRFRAPLATPEGTPTAGQRVALTFEWKVLAQVLSAAEAT